MSAQRFSLSFSKNDNYAGGGYFLFGSDGRLRLNGQRGVILNAKYEFLSVENKSDVFANWNNFRTLGET
jgi:hypothetical protein